MTRHLLSTALAFLLLLPAGLAEAEDLFHLQLRDRLDRPQDGYCIDILGVGSSPRVDLPIFAHNCKRGLTPDSAVSFTENGEIRFAMVDRCVTAAGVNGRALPGVSILVMGCGENSSFMHTAPLQRFEIRDDGAVVLKGTKLCLAAGPASDTTYSVADRWRVLTLEDCGTVPESLSRWAFVTP